MEVGGGVEGRENMSNNLEKLPIASEDDMLQWCVRNWRVGMVVKVKTNLGIDASANQLAKAPYMLNELKDAKSRFNIVAI